MLVKLKGMDGKAVYVNPNFVAFAGGAAQNGQPILGVTGIQMSVGPLLLVKGSLEDIVNLLQKNREHVEIEDAVLAQ